MDDALAERLAAFEAFAHEVRSELQDTGDRLASLREQGKVKTVTYQQLFASRMVLKEIDRRLAEHRL